ncbi:hypothetical protein F5Y05DRAFT_409687 [Hypoxylon sp. FL0543]|nr:hypothetical protein F5Y05DRAFT_409687 [Hypoxylon sp. FL0543]
MGKSPGNSSDTKGKGVAVEGSEQRSGVKILDGASTLHGFTLPDPNFDPSDNPFLKDYYDNKEENGPLNPEEGIEEDVETEARRRVSEWEKVMGRSATDEERERMMNKIRRLRSGSWLEGARAQLVGKTEVPIAWFNRLVAENESCIAFVAQKMAMFSKQRWESQQKINELRETIKKLEEAKPSDAGCQEELDKMMIEKAEMQQQIVKLQENLFRGSSGSRGADNLRERNERVESELRAVYIQRREQDAKISLLENQLKESRDRERAVREHNDKQEMTIAGYVSQIEELQEFKGDVRETVKALRNEGRMLQKEIDALRAGKGESSGAETTESKSDQPGAEQPVNFDTMKILQELKQTSQNGSELSAEANQLIDKWLARVADANNIREFHIAVIELREKMGALQKRVAGLYKNIGAKDGENLEADEIINRIEALLGEQPKNDPLKLSVWSLRQQFEVQLRDRMLELEKTKNQTLRLQLETAKTDDQLEAEMKIRYGIFNDAEVERRVDAKTQMFRQQRRDILDNIFGAANTLNGIAAKCPDVPTREQIHHVREKYLSPTSLPKPKSQRHR